MISRFAPSPTGLLHLGHAYSAWFAADAAEAGGGRFLVRIEDIDPGRCRDEYEQAIYEDLAWLGLRWEQPVRRQSEHMADYARALGVLHEAGLLYPCFCSRKDIAAEIAGAGHAPHHPLAGPDGPLYPGTCRALGEKERERRRQAGEPFALRLDMGRAMANIHEPLIWRDVERGPIEAAPAAFGDVVLARKEVPCSYHLAVTVDDAVQGVTLITRGEDLLAASHIHRLLQHLLGLPVPLYRHHRLLIGDNGRRLAKRDAGLTIRALREAGRSPGEVRAMAGL